MRSRSAPSRVSEHVVRKFPRAEVGAQVKIAFGVDPAGPADLEAEAAIVRLMALYCHAIDWGDADLWADCFTPDGEYHGIRPGGTDNVVKGREALVAYAAKHDSPPVHYPKHMVWAPVVEVDGDQARAIATFAVLNDHGAGPVMDVYGSYEDHLVRVATGWRFQKRFARVEAQTEAFAAGGAPVEK
ncbi:MAG: hypothetical protein JWO98_5456 [Frankiales bacterium]|nr:hypothetical protein [Frankiales bacterium]